MSLHTGVYPRGANVNNYPEKCGKSMKWGQLLYFYGILHPLDTPRFVDRIINVSGKYKWFV